MVSLFLRDTDPHVVDPWFWANTTRSIIEVQSSLNSSIRQLLLQAYCAFNTFNDNTVYIVFICGVYFSLFKFTRPGYLQPLPEVVEPGSSSKRRRLDNQHGEYHETLKKLKSVKDISNSRLSDMVPLECVEVVYHCLPVFENIRDPQIHLSDGFRQALRDCLAGIKLQPCSLFELQTVQFSQAESGLVRSPGNLTVICIDLSTQNTGIWAFTSWYEAAKEMNRTPPRKSERRSVYDESSPIVHQRTGEVIPERSPESRFVFKGGKIDVQPRMSLGRRVKSNSNKPVDGSDTGRDSNSGAKEEGEGEGGTRDGVAK